MCTLSSPLDDELHFLQSFWYERLVSTVRLDERPHFRCFGPVIAEIDGASRRCRHVANRRRGRTNVRGLRLDGLASEPALHFVTPLRLRQFFFLIRSLMLRFLLSRLVPVGSLIALLLDETRFELSLCSRQLELLVQCVFQLR